MAGDEDAPPVKRQRLSEGGAAAAAAETADCTQQQQGGSASPAGAQQCDAANGPASSEQQQQQQQERAPAAAAEGQQPGAAAADTGQLHAQQQPAPQPPTPGAAADAADVGEQQPQQLHVSVGAYAQREQHLQRQEEAGEIEFAYVVNDGAPHNMMRLMGLKAVFSKQLPNMPREYIVRLLLDRRHRSVALLSRSGAVLGGVTYRTFPQQGFGEIAFCAVAASQQVRGFGTRLMNHTKAAARDRDGLAHFLTYADNNAVGYFTKQGFTREITLPRERWVGYIKDYDGGTLMEAVIHPKLPYTDLVGLFRVQKAHLDGQIRQLSNSHVVRPGIPRARLPLTPPHGRVRDIAAPIAPAEVPGVNEAGWSAKRSARPGYRLVLPGGEAAEPTPDNLQRYMADLLAKLQARDEAWPFRLPVDPGEAFDYYDIISDPVDLSLIASRLGSRYYVSLEMFVADVKKMCDNCRYYNAASTPYYQCASKLQAFLELQLDASVVAAPPPQQQQADEGGGVKAEPESAAAAAAMEAA